jgi:hypothetical protein
MVDLPLLTQKLWRPLSLNPWIGKNTKVSSLEIYFTQIIEFGASMKITRGMHSLLDTFIRSTIHNTASVRTNSWLNYSKTNYSHVMNLDNETPASGSCSLSHPRLSSQDDTMMRWEGRDAILPLLWSGKRWYLPVCRVEGFNTSLIRETVISINIFNLY